jgi:hypothetical protein
MSDSELETLFRSWWKEAARQLGGGCAEIVHRYLGQQ